jgi:hypothetical protein
LDLEPFADWHLTLLVDVRLNVPVGVGIARVVFLGAGHLDLLETPLRQVDVAGAQIAAHRRVLQTEARGQGADLAPVAGRGVADNLNLPVVLIVTDSSVAVARNLPLRLGDGRGDLVRMQVAAGLGVEQTDGLAISDEARIGFGVIGGIVTVRVKEPVVVGVLVVVAGHLLLARAVGVGLDVAVEKTAAITHVLDGGHGTIVDLQGAVPADLGSPKVGLEERGHLSVARSGVGEDGKVDGEAEQVDEERQDDQANDARHKVGSQHGLHFVSSQIQGGVCELNLPQASWCRQTCSTGPRWCTGQREP